MKSKSKDKLQSGAIVTFFNSLCYKLIQLTSLSEGVKDLFVYLSTPLSLVLAWGVIIIIKLFGDLKAEDILLNRETNKDIKKARDIIKNPKSTSIEIDDSSIQLKSLLSFQKNNRNKQLKKLAQASEQAQSSTEHMEIKVPQKQK
jgi:hypothetical protein